MIVIPKTTNHHPPAAPEEEVAVDREEAVINPVHQIRRGATHKAKEVKAKVGPAITEKDAVTNIGTCLARQTKDVNTH